MGKNRFGDSIEFDEIFLEMVYTNGKENQGTKLYSTSEYTTVETKEEYDWGQKKYRTKYPGSTKRCVFHKLDAPMTGIIIGQTKKSEGEYSPFIPSESTPNGVYEAEPASLDVSKVYTFWVVATSMNSTQLVPKNI
jgi:hypothetical protein